MAEFRKLPTQAELQNMLFMEQMRVKTPQQIAQEALASGTTVTPIPENVFQKIAGGARMSGQFVNRIGTAADIAKLFPGYQPQTKVTIPTGYNFAPKQAPTGEIIPGGLQTQDANLGQVLGAIKPADVLGLTGFEKAYTDVGLGKAPQPLDVLDVAAVGYLPAKAAMSGARIGKAVLSVGKNLPIGLSIKDVSKTGGLLTEAPRSPLGFYSALEESALNLQRNKGSGQAFLNDLQKAPNVKADEIKWTGLDEFLKTKPNVTKQEVQDYLANNRVDVQEVQLGAGTVKSFEQWAADQGLTPEAIRAYEPSLRNSYEAFKNSASQKVGAAKFGQYTLPGGENYREILLTMPQKQEGQVIKSVDGKYRFKASDGEIYGEGYATRDEALAAQPTAGVLYQSPHFPTGNILAHLRVNDRVDADGKKMLLVEEVQSDWHQTGREKGYKGQLTSLPDDYFVSEMTKTNGDVVYEIRKKSNPNVIINRDYNRQSAINGAINTLNETVMGVPDAPFKDSWYQLALKRAIQYAAENGYDRIGLTTGSQQAARFDLSKQLSRVSYQDGVLHGYDKSGSLVMNKAVTPDELPNYVGKELGSKMAENAAKDAEIRNKISVARYERKPESEINALRSQLDDVKTDYAGLDLQVGGEGMKKYYDEIYPKFLDKYGKKWGARVGETKVNANGIQEPIRYLDVTPEMKASVSKGQPLFQALPAIPATGLLATQDEER